MARDSLYGETILWTGRPRVVATPRAYKLAAVGCAVVAAVALSFAVVVGTAFHVQVGGMLIFSLWCATLALGAWRLPALWRSGLEYIVTDKHVICRRGRIRRTIDRSAISYALIRWDPQVSGAGDLVLVRAVPTGALRRTLKLTLAGVAGPDRLWAIVRGLTPSAPLGDGDRPLTQRLDPGERVLWSATPLASPWTPRRALSATIALILSISAVRMVAHAIPPLRRVFRLHALPATSLAIFVAGVALAALLLMVVAVGVAYAACVRPVRLARATRYFVTDQRVLIRRANEELHLDRSRIAYVIAAPSHGLHDVFIVLDGPQARAFASSGAFGEKSVDTLVPVFSAIEDAETVGALLHPEQIVPLPHAA